MIKNVNIILRTTTKFTTTTTVDRESTGTRTSVLVGHRELKMQSLGKDDDGTECKQTVHSQQSFFVMASFKTMQDLFLSQRSNFIDGEEFLVLSDLFEWRNPCFP